jgi:hypothetical protein
MLNILLLPAYHDKDYVKNGAIMIRISKYANVKICKCDYVIMPFIFTLSHFHIC